MSGEWIKMRNNLWDDPRVGAIVDATDTCEAQVIGALYWLWASADEHTEDGYLPGLTLRQIDRKVGMKGFAEAVAAIGWLHVVEGGIHIARFGEHNGASAKRRASESRRKVSARDADKMRTKAGQKTDNPGSFAHLEEEGEEEQEQGIETLSHTPPAAVDGLEGSFEGHDDKPSPGPTPAGMCAVALNRAGFQITSINPTLLAYLSEGGSLDHLLQLTTQHQFKGKGAGYLLAAARRELTAPAPTVTQGGNGIASPPARIQTAKEALAGAKPDPSKQTAAGPRLALDALKEAGLLRDTQP